MRHSEETSATEAFLRKQERSFNAERKISAFMFIPVFVVILSLLVSAFLILDREVNCSDSLLKSKTDTEQTIDAEFSEAELGSEAVRNGKIDINTADEKLLETLPGIGEVKAREIVEARTKMGGFKSIGDLLNIEGVGEKTFEKIKNMIFVE